MYNHAYRLEVIPMRVAVMGATGYAGMTLVKYLLKHPKVRIEALTTHHYTGESLADLNGAFRGENLPELISHEDLLIKMADLEVVFLALPHGVTMDWVKAFETSHALLIDLSGDYRLSAMDYENWYGQTHRHVQGLKRAVYGLPEVINRVSDQTKLIANPGCYPTASILALAPLVAAGCIDTKNIIIDAKSGASGTGRSAVIANLYCEINETLRPYGVSDHRHTPEIERILSQIANEAIMVQFTPHLIPMQSGLLVTCYASLNREMSQASLWELYSTYYHKAPFIRLIEGLPETRWVVGSNFADIGIRLDLRTGRVMVFCAIDNTIKGAAGQAIQNMNRALGLDETLGLR